MAPQLPKNGSSQMDGRGQTCEPSSMSREPRASCFTSGLAPLLEANAYELGINDGFMATAHVLLMASQLP
eukprot:13611186-Alexandrium_andersonii.AAC.1